MNFDSMGATALPIALVAALSFPTTTFADGEIDAPAATLIPAPLVLSTVTNQVQSHWIPSATSLTLGTSCSLIDFEGFAHGSSLGTVAGTPNVTFGPSWFAIIDSDAPGGGANIANEPSESTVATFLDVADPIDFDTAVRYVELFYSATAASIPITLTAWDGPNGTGNIIDSQAGLTVGNSVDGASCTGDPSGNFCLWDRIILTAPSDTIMSITIDGATTNEFAFDNMLFCTDVPCDTLAVNAPIPGSGVNPVGILTPIGLPAINNLAYQVAVDDPLNVCGLSGNPTPVYLFWSRTPTQFMMPGLGCGLGEAGEVLVAPPFTLIRGPEFWAPGTPAVFDVPIPNRLELCGYDCFAQALFIDPAAAGGPYLISNGLSVIVGI